ncbi:hypothetical protein A3E46_02980 [Candidatus Woesebacteria bacterium RIFCSPHIGHO2_12_FULL_46_16]|uniref:Deoxynucleoside kinase domain-containing protein n=1 Tax=Candidatus Woesebacteria bacterium RIFCSPHIGHO2_12_FULL_46_16 TaxID=1802513 RepID=A0A1F8B038_9BACT|nr:MAG: hypothetical protein A3E46_02980 [Candidatus Woesebacteria bacterium RIFCSPHIGHO2_12_FULL_46_16]
MSPEHEPKPRNFLIGVLGPIGAGKSTLCRVIREQWRTREVTVEILEEQFLGNPHLAGFYDVDPRIYSFPSEIRFVTDAALQLSTLSRSRTLESSCAIADPAYEMHGIYPEVHLEMDWLSEEEIKIYRNTFQTLKMEHQLPTPDIFFVVNAPVPTLLERIQARAKERPMERNLLDKPWGEEYLTRLANAVDRWYSQKICEAGHPPVIRLDSELVNFSNDDKGQGSVIKDVGDWIRYYFVDHQVSGSDGAPLVIPQEIYTA